VSCSRSRFEGAVTSLARMIDAENL
jgi:hypothetical protein